LPAAAYDSSASLAPTSDGRGVPADRIGEQADRPRLERRFLGPGWIIGAASDDPASVGTYAVAGAAQGFATLWATVVTVPMLVAIQFISAKVGMVNGTGLAGVLRRHYSPGLVYPVVAALTIANTFQAGADIAAAATAVRLMVPVPGFALVIGATLLILLLQVRGPHRVAGALFKAMSLTLLAYVGAALLARPNLIAVLRGTFLPAARFDLPYLLVLLAIFGTTVSPYMWFWQSSQEARLLRDNRRAGATGVRAAAVDIGTGMVFSNLVAYFIIVASAATLHRAGSTHIASMAEALDALRPLAGNAVGALFAAGMVGAAFLGVPVLGTSTAFMVTEASGSLRDGPARWSRERGLHMVLAAATGVAILISVAGFDPLAALFWTGVINGVLAPPLLALLMLVTGNRRIMGDHTNGRALNIIGWGSAALMFGIAAGLVLAWIRH